MVSSWATKQPATDHINSTNEKLMEEVEKWVREITEWIADCHKFSRGDYNSIKGTNFGSNDDIRRVPLADSVFPIGVKPSPELVMAIQQLTNCVAAANYAQQTGHVGKNGNQILNRIARIPGFVKTLLLIEEAIERAEIFNFPLVRLVLLSKDCLCRSNSGEPTSLSSSRRLLSVLVDSSEKCWLLEMLDSRNSIVNEKAVDFLEYISSVRFRDHVKYYKAVNLPPHLHKAQNSDQSNRQNSETCAEHSRVRRQFNCEQTFNTNLQALYDEIQSLHYFPSLLVMLPLEQLERASITAVVQWVLQNSVRNPLNAIMIFADFIFHLSLLFSFRAQLILTFTPSGSGHFVTHASDMFGELAVLRALSFSCLGIFIARAIETGITLSMVSPVVYWKYVVDSYAWFDTLCILLALAANLGFVVHADDEEFPRLPINFGSIALGFLWLRLIGFLQILNHKLATYYFAIIQICGDIALFVLILIVTILGFGDMLYVIYSSEEEACHGEEEQSQFCFSPIKSYFAVYQILVGAFELSDFDTSLLTKVLYIAVTGFVVLIMLNILIAIVSESYEVSILRTYKLFGRARAVQVARHRAWVSLIFPNEKETAVATSWKSALSRSVVWILNFLCLLGLMYVFVLIGCVIYDGIKNEAAMITVLVLYSSVVLNGIVSALVYVTMSRRKGWTWLKQFTYDNSVFQCMVKRPIMWLTLSLLGATNEPTIEDLHAIEDKWKGRLDHTRTVVTNSVRESEQNLVKTIAHLQAKVEEMEQKLADSDDKHADTLRTILESIRVIQKQQPQDVHEGSLDIPDSVQNEQGPTRA